MTNVNPSNDQQWVENNLKPEVEPNKIDQTIEEWSSLTAPELQQRVDRLKFIVDMWACLDDYQDLKLADGYSLATTSKNSDTPGTIFLAHTDPVKNKRLQASIKMFVANHGLTPAQTDTFVATRYYGKFKLLHLLITVLNDKALYSAYRSYSRRMPRSEYFKWIKDNNLHQSEFNISLTPVERTRLSELLDRMVRTDKLLRAEREEFRARNTLKDNV